MEKLLGVSQRFCPNCGAAQNPETRYFPEDEDKVTVADHEYMGADKHCSACDTPNAAAAKHCINCGNNMSEEGEVERKIDPSEKKPVAAPPPPPKKSSPIFMIIVGGILFVGVLICGLSFIKTSAGLSVSGHAWKQSQAVQEYKQVKEENWQDKVPTKGEVISCFEKKKSTKKVEDGQDCKMVKKDKGDGSFVEKEKCTTKYKEVPVMGQYCKYTIKKWDDLKPLTSSGNDLKPYAPKGKIKTCTGTKIGCQRKGKLTETYTVKFKNSEKKDKVYTCDFSQKDWKKYTVGANYDGSISMLGKLDCDSLKVKK